MSLPAEAEDTVISDETMQQVYEKLQTPYKYGQLLTPAEDEYYDCPNVFRHNDKWLMILARFKDKVGYETILAESDNLLDWKITGTLLGYRDEGWDRWQADGSIALMDPRWGGSHMLEQHDGKYWISYFGGHKKGYETDPLSIGMAWTTTPDKSEEWNRLEQNPVMTPDDEGAREFEKKTLYKSHIFHDRDQTLGAPFVMFYNAKQQGDWIERIGIAVSDDMQSWRRYGDGPVIDNLKGISGDPQIIRMGDLWVMAYFGAGWKKGAFDTFAVSRDLVNWTKWEGEDLLKPSEPWDTPFAHKPWIIKHDGVVYHFYCSVGGKVRTIALATSRDLRKGETKDSQ
ncbi:Glycosyl hydrolases family 43 [Durusdinium trenchii]|uniref:Glycosyl hydrolases family 43 n=1 Tax=Durusdinium trenchii TaxID=1381693 RepID=A0ABP0LGR8_9DINO